MREILFRGKRIDNGEWGYGYFCGGNERKSLNPAIFIYLPKTQSYDRQEIDVNTLGQYTGKTDACGTQIFENDICRFDNGEEFKGKDRFSNYVVQWDSVNTRYVVVDEWNCEDILDEFFSRNAIVIGNIHDNPELMGGAQ